MATAHCTDGVGPSMTPRKRPRVTIRRELKHRGHSRRSSFPPHRWTVEKSRTKDGRVGESHTLLVMPTMFFDSEILVDQTDGGFRLRDIRVGVVIRTDPTRGAAPSLTTRLLASAMEAVVMSSQSTRGWAQAGRRRPRGFGGGTSQRWRQCRRPRQGTDI